ncbi:MAG TPA: ribonuclease T2 [Pseudolabrys sp.]|nr:ribonuclease T2 [Pseudolabrys sp.]
MAWSERAGIPARHLAALRWLARVARTGAVTGCFVFLFAIVAFAQDAFAQDARAQDRRQNAPGQFDFYVLSLSWSPSYCEASAERGGRRSADIQCSGRPFAFVVHGLWPQYDRGFPEYCKVPAPRLNRAIVGAMLDLMPSQRLVYHEWDKHGTCSGLSPNAYFENVRKARAAVKIPEGYLDHDKPMMVSPGDVAAAFLRANPGLTHQQIAVTCDSKRLSEVRVCMSKDFAFHDCPETARRACRRDKVVMPAVRGGS